MVYHEGINPLFLAIIGEKQNIGKTEWIRRLFPKELAKYVAEPKGMSYKKDQELSMMLSENLIIFDDELAGRSTAEINSMKALTSTEYVTVRRPYHMRQEKYRRIASLAGTSNELDILKDPTGNRRISPFHVDSISFDEYNEINKHDLWYEVFQLFKSGFSHELSKEDIQFLNENSTDFKRVDPVVEELEKRFISPKQSKIGRMTSTEVAQIITQSIPNNRFVTPERIGKTLKRLGYKQDRSDGSRSCLLSTSDAAADMQCVELRGPGISKKKNIIKPTDG